MKSHLGKIFKWALAILGIGAAAACEEIAGGLVEEYGCPYMEFEVSGKVSDIDSNPIKGIMVFPVEKNILSDQDYLEHYIQEQIQNSHNVLTSEDGTYKLVGGGFPDDSVQIFFYDVDGEENGEFEPVSVIAKLEDSDGKEAEGWFAGTKKAENVNAIMLRIKNEQ